MKRFAGVADGVQMHLRNISNHAPALRQASQQVLPLRLRNPPESHAQKNVTVALGSYVNIGVEAAGLGELAIHLDVEQVLYRGFSRGAHQAAMRVVGGEQGLFVAKLIHNQAVRRYFRRAVEPGELRSEAHGGDFMIELRRRGNVGINLAVAVDQHRIALNALRMQQSLQQRVLVLAVTVAFWQDSRGLVRLQAADTK